MTEPLLSVEHLSVRYGEHLALDDVSLEVRPGEVLAVVGESGSGKTTLALAITGLLEGARVEGSIRWRGEELVAASPRQQRRVRGGGIAMVFQDPRSSLNPVQRVGSQVAEVRRVHAGSTRRGAREEAVELLASVGIPEPRRRARQYPHELSGGMSQRVAIAMALAGRPDVLIADEPTSALDVTVQAQILELFAEVGRERAAALLLITHDLGVVAGLADRTMVLYAGRCAESGPTEAVFADPRHPYTRKLLEVVPRLDRETPAAPTTALPDPAAAGCAFHPRCRLAVPGLCDVTVPVAESVGEGHVAACHLASREVHDRR